MRRYLTALAVALVALSGAARVWSTNVSQSTLPVVISYDLDSTSFVYPVAYGPMISPSTVPNPQAAEGWYGNVSQPASPTEQRKIKTADYDPTAVSCVTNSSAFLPVSTGDMIQVNDVFGRPNYASVYSKTTAETIEFDRSLDITQSGCAAYKYRKLVAGSNSYDGWFPVAGWAYTTVQIDIEQMAVTGGIDLQVECSATPALTTAQVLVSSNVTATGSYAVAIPEPWDVCRVGMKIGTSDDDTSPTTSIEKVSVFAIRR